MTSDRVTAPPLEFSVEIPRPVRVAVGACGLAVLLAAFGSTWELPVYLFMAAALSAAAFIDLDSLRLPNALLGPTFLVGAVLLPVITLTTDRGSVASAAAASALGLFGMAVLHAVYPAGMGLGDVKLGAVMGLYLGWLGWSAVGTGFAVGFVAAGLAAALLLFRYRHESSALPFGPFLIGGTVLACALHAT